MTLHKQNPIQKLTSFRKSVIANPYMPWQSAFNVDALRRAWTSVRANKGKGGSDGETVAQFEKFLEINLKQLHEECINGTYRPRRVTQILVPKPSRGWRPLTLWTIRDRVVQRAVYNYLEPAFEKRFLPCSFGYRSGKKTADVAKTIQQAYQAGARWVYDADIKDCFGSMKNKYLLKRLQRWRVPRQIRHMIHRWLQTEIWNNWQGSGKIAGTSQGGIISPLMCNLYLHPFDQAMQQRNLWLVRYADDFVLLARDQARLQQASHQARKQLQHVGLHINPHKTQITTFDQGFQFVGWFFIRDEMYKLN